MNGFTAEKELCMQSASCSLIDDNEFCAIDTEIVKSATKALLHRQSRFLLVTSGDADIMIQNKIHRIHESSLVAILPWQYSKIVKVERELRYYLIIFNFELFNRLIKNSLNALGENIDLFSNIQRQNVVTLSEKDTRNAEDAARGLIRECGIRSLRTPGENSSLRALLSISYIVELLVYFGRNIDSWHLKRKNGRYIPYKTEIFHYIYNHISEKPLLEELSRIFLMSESSISKYIKSSIGYTYTELLDEMRVLKSLNYLRYSDRALDEFAEDIGFVDASHLSRNFCKKMGISTAEYRRGCIFRTSHNYLSPEEDNPISYILENFDHDISPESVGEIFHISPTDIRTTVKYQYDMGFYDFLNFLRIHEACDILINSQKLISDIAYEVGYNTTKTFVRNFLKIMKMCPKDFRRIFMKKK